MAGRARVCLIWANEEETEARTRLGAFIWCWTAPRHDADEGGIASERGEEEHGVVLSAMHEEKMRTSSSSIFWTKGYAGWVGLLLDCVAGPRWWTASWAARPGEPLSVFSFIFCLKLCF
jgi:hypothetical protein